MLMVGGVVEKTEPPDLTHTSPEWNPGFCLASPGLKVINQFLIVISSQTTLTSFAKTFSIYSLVLGIIRPTAVSSSPGVPYPFLLNALDPILL